jgi:hypothetical protein
VIRKTVYVLNIDDYAPELTALTYPHIKFWADKIGAHVYKITERKFPTWDIPYEKLQIYELARERKDDWSIYIDSDALVHPELPDLTTLVPRDTVMHNGADFAPIRWKYDEYFLRDGRHIGSCNWLAVASSWCRDLWRPLDDLTFAQAIKNITVTVEERHSGIRAEHLIDDYTLSRNIARFGLKFTTLIEVWKNIGLQSPNFFHHQYTIPVEDKINQIRKTIEDWRL